MPFAQERMGFGMPPRLFLRNDEANAENPLGKTAYYDPGKKSITLYIAGRHPKDIMRSLSHELVHHTQNCRGEFEGASEMGEGYAQNDEHLREMEREAYETGNLCFRDWEDSIKSTIYFESLQRDKGDNRNMSTKDWKNKEITKLLSEAWGFDFNLNNLNEGSKKPDYIDIDGDGDKEESMKDAAADKKEKSVDEGAFAPNHYCVHHGGVSRNGSVELAEAVNHNYNAELGRVTHYDMKFADGTIMENVAAEDIQVTDASLEEDHSHSVGKRDDDEDSIDEMSTPDSPDRVGGRDAGGRRVRPLEEDEIEEVAGVAPRASDRRSPHKRKPVPEDDAEKSEEEKQVAEDVFDSIRAELREAIIKALNEKRSQ